MKKRITVALALAAVISGFVCTNGAVAAPPTAKFVWYAPAPHPYFDAVKEGVDAFEKEYGITVKKQIGPDWNMDSENTGMLALAAGGYTHFSFYPVDASAANGLVDEIVKKNGKVLAFGASPNQPTQTSAAVVTDVKAAAMTAAKYVFDKVKGKGTVVNVLEVLEDPNTKLRKEGVDEVAAKYPSIKVIEVAGIKSEQEAVEKIESSISSAGGYVDGIITTGFVPAMALSKVVTDYETKSKKHIAACGIDDDPQILEAINKGYLDATIAQNPTGHGYLSMLILKMMSEGYKVKPGVYKIDAGVVLVTKSNIGAYKKDLVSVNARIKSELPTKYLAK